MMNLYRKVGIASLIMMASVFLSRVIGLIREMVIAYAAGAGAAVDAYQVAFVLPEILNHMLASGFLSVTFIPIFSGYLAQGREDEGWRVLSIILVGFGSLMIGLILAAEFLAEPLVALVAPGFDRPEVMAAAIRMTRIILPAQFFFFAGGLFMAVQFARERFTVPALAPLIYNFGIILGGLFLGRRLGMEGFSWGVLAGAFAGNFALQYWGARRAGMRLYFVADFRHPDLRRYVLLSLPLMLGLTMTFSTEFFLKFFGSYLPPGSIAGLNYGLRITFILIGFFGQAVGVASFPFMARLIAEGKLDEMNRLLNTSLRYLSLVIPFSVLFMVLRYEVVRLLFQRGRFDSADTALTAHVLIFLLIGAAAFSAQTVVVRGYYAMQNTLFPAIFSTLAVAVSIPLYWIGMDRFGAGGVALAVSLSAMLQVLVLYALWNRRSGNRGQGRVYRFYLRIMLVSLVIGTVLEWVKRELWRGIDPATVLGSLSLSAIIGALFLILLMGTARLFRIQEVAEVMDRVAGKLGRIRKS